MRLALLLLLPACGPAAPEGTLGDPALGGATWLVGEDPLPPPMALSVTAMTPGQTSVLSVSGANPGVRVYFLHGRSAGTTCLPALAGACLGITSPVVLGSAIAGAGGVATLSVPVPANVPVGTVAWFQAGTLPNPTAVLSDVVRRVAGGGGPSGFLVADTATNRIYQLDPRGAVTQSWASPVADVRGVAWDHRAQDGFWVTGLGDLHAAYKLDLNGAAIDALPLAEPTRDVRGLDYWPSPTGDLLTMVSWNALGLQVVYGFLTDGTRWLESSHYENGFLSGFWGIAAVAQVSDIERWTTWSNGDLEYWPGSGGRTSDVAIGGPGLRGVDTDDNGDIYVVDANRRVIHHLSPTGAPIGTMPLNLSDPADISIID